MPFTETSRITTIDSYISNEERLYHSAGGDFSLLLHDLTLAIRIISRDVRRAGISDVLGLTNEYNYHGEQVAKLDKYSNEVIKKALIQGGRVCVTASEEDVQIVVTPDENANAKYVLLYDPLDGSSNVDVNITVGTIFSIYKRLDLKQRGPGNLQDVLQPGYKQIAAGYALYGSSTILVYTSGRGVNAFTYDPTLGEFLLTHENIKIDTRGSTYSCNEGNYNKWDQNVRDYVNYLRTPSDDYKRPYSQRYLASGAADIHRTMLHGGIYFYPADYSHPEGKFRLIYEANALAMVVERAGGRASNGVDRILEITPETIHQCTPLVIGSKDDVLEYEQFMRGEHPFQLRSF